jgi:formylglycine-generating enzyme required for sulfatase activity/uncharacterized caspase-like protein
MGRNWAITIGINGYRNLQRLNYAQQDAEAMRQLFSQELDFQHIYHFTDDSPPIPQDYGSPLDSQPTYTTLRRFLRTRFEQPFLRDGDNLWFFFAGHGIRDQNRDYLMPLDGDRSDLDNSAISINYISERLRQSGADNIILLIDACRSLEGRRDGLGIGQEKQQGVITLFSCSPEESAYEIAELQQGTFTYVLLESLRLQGEGNCATVERLYQRLRYYVPQITQRYRGISQTPYGVIEPPTKNHLILLPRRATLADIETLKKDALTAEVQGDAQRAKQYWVRVLVASPGDPEAIEGIERLSRFTPTPAPPTTFPQPPEPSRVTPRSVSPAVQPRPAPAAPQPLVNRPTPAIPLHVERSASPISRRRAIQILGFTGGGIGAVLVGRAILQSSPDALDPAPPQENPPTPSPPPTTPSDPNPPETPATLALTAADFTPFDFEVVKVNETGEVASREPKQAQAFREAIGATFLELVAVPGGTFTMGSPAGEEGRDWYGDFADDLKGVNVEGPQREVNVPAFLMGKYPVTQAQWKAVAALPKVARDLNADPANFKGDNLPVEQVSWDEAVEFCQRLSKQTGREYRLPSEAEWEYACRARTTTPFHFGETITTDLANYRGTDWDYQGKTYPGNYGQGPKGEFRQKTTEVGSFKIANTFGLYDMHGNVWDWCLDHWHESYEGAPTDGSAWTTGGDDSLRVLRGGSWGDIPRNCRSACRDGYARGSQNFYLGFRLVCASSWAL